MERIHIDQSNAARDEWTDFDVRMCLKGGKIPAVEMHIDHYRKEFDRKQGRAHTNFPVLTIDQATKLRDALDAAIAEAGAHVNA